MTYDIAAPEPTPEEALRSDLARLAQGWEDLGIDPDDFVRCGTCHEFLVDDDGSFRLCACERAAAVEVKG